MKITNSKKKFIYLISPNHIKSNFYKDLREVLSLNKAEFFQLRLKNVSSKKKILIGKKIKKICKCFKVKFLVNDDPMIAKKINADGCHLGQKDMDIAKARKILKNKIIGITCHNSLKLAKKAIECGASYLAFGAFYSSKTKKINADGCHLGQKDMDILKAKKILKNKIVGVTCHNSIKLAKKALACGVSYLAFGAFYSSQTKKVKFKANLKILSLAKKLTNTPIVAIGGIKDTNYKKLLLNKANFLAISSYIWNNKKLNPKEAINKII